jgi:hypothetical protein
VGSRTAASLPSAAAAAAHRTDDQTYIEGLRVDFLFVRRLNEKRRDARTNDSPLAILFVEIFVNLMAEKISYRCQNRDRYDTYRCQFSHKIIKRP